MRFTSEQRLGDGLVQREFTLGETPGVLWMPDPSPVPVPVVLLGHPGGLSTMHRRLVARARSAAARGLASATLELPGSGDRPPVPGIQQARADVRRILRAGERVDDALIDRLVLPLVERAAPEWQTMLDELLAVPDIVGPVGYSGGVISVGVRLARVEPRIAAAALFAGSFIPRATLDEAHDVTIPVRVLLQWDDEGNDRDRALELFDAFGSTDKSLHANMGGHTGVPAHAGEGATSFLAGHLLAGRDR